MIDYEIVQNEKGYWFIITKDGTQNFVSEDVFESHGEAELAALGYLYFEAKKEHHD